MSDLPATLDDIENAPDGAALGVGDTLVGEDDYRRALARLGDERDALLEELEGYRDKNATIKILDSLIKPYALRTFIFMCLYCVAVGVLLTLDGLNAWGFDLPDNVLQLLVGSTATTVLGLVGMVLTGIFVGARRNHD